MDQHISIVNFVHLFSLEEVFVWRVAELLPFNLYAWRMQSNCLIRTCMCNRQLKLDPFVLWQTYITGACVLYLVKTMPA